MAAHPYTDRPADGSVSLVACVAQNPVCRHMLVQTMHWRYVVIDEGHVLKNEEVSPGSLMRAGRLMCPCATPHAIQACAK